jgi:hypothetical protein
MGYDGGYIIVAKVIKRATLSSPFINERELIKLKSKPKI